MSKPMRDTIYGTVSFKNHAYGVLEHFHLDEIGWKKIKKLGKPEIYSPFASWNNYQPQWCVEDEKLYLIDISLISAKNTMKETFGTSKLFAEWVNEPMKMLVTKSKQKSVSIDREDRKKKTIYEVIMDLTILEFENGVLKNREDIQESYRILLKNYIEEID